MRQRPLIAILGDMNSWADDDGQEKALIEQSKRLVRLTGIALVTVVTAPIAGLAVLMWLLAASETLTWEQANAVRIQSVAGVVVIAWSALLLLTLKVAWRTGRAWVRHRTLPPKAPG